MIPVFFFLSLSSFEVERQEQSSGGGPARRPTGRWCSDFAPFPAHYCLLLARCNLFFWNPNPSFAMAGAIIENMSTKKLVIVGVTLLLFQAFAFMVGGLIGEFLCFTLSPVFKLTNVNARARASTLTSLNGKKHTFNFSRVRVSFKTCFIVKKRQWRRTFGCVLCTWAWPSRALTMRRTAVKSLLCIKVLCCAAPLLAE